MTGGLILILIFMVLIIASVIFVEYYNGRKEKTKIDSNSTTAGDIDKNIMNYANKYSNEDLDIDVILKFGQCLENLHKGRLPNISDLSDSPERIKEAISNLEKSERVPEHLKKLSEEMRNWLKYYELGERPII